MRTLLSSSFSRMTRTSFVRLSITSFWSATCLRVDLGLLIEARVDGLQRVGDRADQVLQQLRLLLEHAQVGHQLLMFFVRARAGDARR